MESQELTVADILFMLYNEYRDKPKTKGKVDNRSDSVVVTIYKEGYPE